MTSTDTPPAHHIAHNGIVPFVIQGLREANINQAVTGWEGLDRIHVIAYYHPLAQLEVSRQNRSGVEQLPNGFPLMREVFNSNRVEVLGQKPWVVKNVHSALGDGSRAALPHCQPH